MSRTHHHGKGKFNLYPYSHWYLTEPKYWRKLMKHKKRRSQLRVILHKVKENPNKDYIFPLDSKPWIYYW